MLSQRLMLVCTMEDMDMVLVWDMLDLDMDIPVLDMLDMVVMDSDMEDMDLDMDVPSMVKQLIYASKSSRCTRYPQGPPWCRRTREGTLPRRPSRWVRYARRSQFWHQHQLPSLWRWTPSSGWPQGCKCRWQSWQQWLWHAGPAHGRTGG